jgi:acyl dehydratase
MPCDSRIVGSRVGPFEYDVDQFWTMAYAAGLGDSNPRYLDSLRFGQLIAHPVFPVCLATRARWQMEPLFLEAGLTPEESIRSVHVTQDMTIHRPIHPPERLTVNATVSAMERRKSGTYLLTSYEISGSDGAPVATVHWGRMWRGVGMTGEVRSLRDLPQRPATAAIAGEQRKEIRMPISPTAAVVYTACARADNPVNFHTDTASAQRSRLPQPILMGVATLGMSVSSIIDSEAGGDPERVQRICARFGSMVFMPSVVTLRIGVHEHGLGANAVPFEIVNPDGSRAIRDGLVILRQ